MNRRAHLQSEEPETNPGLKRQESIPLLNSEDIGKLSVLKLKLKLKNMNRGSKHQEFVQSLNEVMDYLEMMCLIT